MKRMFSLSLLFVSFFTVSNSQNCDNLSGPWINELGSIVEIDSIKTQSGEVFGVYKSSLGVDGRNFPLLGWTNYKDENDKEDHSVIAISFLVRWGEYGSITSWTGYCSNDAKGPFIKTIWNLVRSVSDQEFEHIITNSSTFRPHPEK
jgi:hypothetical protein